MKLKIFLVILSAAVILIGCGEEGSTNNQDVESIKDLVNDYSLGNINDKSASITSQQLIVEKNDGEEKVYDISEEDFFVSIAPYVNQTHPCTNHSLTGCHGEMVEESFDVYIEDMEGNVILDDKVKTMSNGFFDLWLPRDRTYQVKIEHDGKDSESEISTYETDGTCITDMQLS